MHVEFKIFPIVFLIIFVQIIFLSFITGANAAIIEGKIYEPNLELAKKALVRINSTPPQSLVAHDGAYSFALQEGTYKLEAFYVTDSVLLYAKEIIILPQEGTFNIDLILFEIPEIEDFEFDEIELKLIENLMEKEGKSYFWLNRVIILLALVIIVLALIFILKRKKKKKRKLRKKKKASKGIGKTEVEFTDEIMKKVLEILKREKRVYQKDLRKRLGVSEAKVSLLVADLEAQNKIKKIKRGRSNIIIYQE